MAVKLTSRERDVYAGLIAGDSNQEIADRMFVTVKGVKNHVSNILRKTGCDSRVRLIVAHYTGTIPELLRAPRLRYDHGALPLGKGH